MNALVLSMCPSKTNVVPRFSLTRWLETKLCSLKTGGEHKLIMRRDQPDRIYGECADCGHTTPGWELETRKDRS